MENPFDVTCDEPAIVEESPWGPLLVRKCTCGQLAVYRLNTNHPLQIHLKELHDINLETRCEEVWEKVNEKLLHV